MEVLKPVDLPKKTGSYAFTIITLTLCIPTKLIATGLHPVLEVKGLTALGGLVES